MLNLAGPEYDFGHVVYAVIAECEHRRRGFGEAQFEHELMACAKEKLATIKECYDEFGGSAVYWNELEKEVLRSVMPQYSIEAWRMTELERSGFGVFRQGDLAARCLFALAGLTIGGIIVALPFIPIMEDMFAFALMAGGFVYPDLKRFLFEHRHMRALNALVTESARYQQTSGVHFVSTSKLTESLQPGPAPELGSRSDQPSHGEELTQ